MAKKRHYGFAGGLVTAGVIVAAFLAYQGAVGLGWFTVQSALFGLGLASLVLAGGLTYILFTLRTSLMGLRMSQTNVHERLAALEASRLLHSSTNGDSFAPMPERKGAYAARIRRAPVVEIEGIGPEYAARLKTIGIKSVADLKAADHRKVAASISVRPEQAHQWQSMADLMEIKGIGKQYSELLVRAGVHSVEDLASSHAKELFGRIGTLEATTMEGTQRQNLIQGNTITLERVGDWIKDAKHNA